MFIIRLEGKLYDIEPKLDSPYIERTIEERQTMAEAIRCLINNSKELRVKKFIEKREKILKELEKEEVMLGLLPTTKKIDEWNKSQINKYKE